MITLPGYKLIRLLESTDEFEVYRGISTRDERSVVVRILRGEATDTCRQRYRDELALLREIRDDGILEALRVETAAGRPALVFRHFAGRLATAELFEGSVGLRRFLAVAVSLTHILARVHRARIVHGNLRPSVVMVVPESMTLKLMGFCHARRLDAEQTELFVDEVPRTGMSYLAPEQTGRMDRGVDYRSDLYALGATFYELLTGQPPFGRADRLELIHAHLAREPAAPTRLRTDLPEMVSRVVLKLLAKEPEQRYQTAEGLALDLERCAVELEGQGHIDLFELGRHDAPVGLVVPRRLYGRADEVAALLAACGRSTAGGEVLALVRGPEGCGKSSLVAEMRLPVLGWGGYFAVGKFDQYRRDVPYAAIAEAFATLTRQLLTESDARLAELRRRLETALGGVGGVVTELVPDLAHVLGEQPPLEPLDPNEARNRFLLAVRRLVRALCSPDRPLVLFLDDLQWADSGSLMLLEDLVTTGATAGLFIVGSLRDAEVDGEHPLRQLLAGLRERGVGTLEIALGPLSDGAVAELVADTVGRSPADSAPLAAIVSEKTGNNPLFVHQFLLHLADRGLLRWEHGTGWDWDARVVASAGVPRDLATMLAAKMEKLPEPQLRLLVRASCIGRRFSRQALESVCASEEPEELARNLHRLVAQGFLTPTMGGWRFGHDSIQEAASALLGEADRMRLHLYVGRFELLGVDAHGQRERVFDIVDHLLRARALISDPAERLALASLSLEAGQRALESAAYGPARRYLTAGIELLPADAWRAHYRLAADLHLELAQCAFHAGDRARAAAAFEDLLAQELTFPDRGRVIAQRVQQLVLSGDAAGALREGIAGLRQCGFQLPFKGNKLNLLRHAAQTLVAMHGKDGEDFLALPPATDPRAQAALEILPALSSAAYLSDNDLLIAQGLLNVRLLLRYGSHPQAGEVLCKYSIAIAAALGKPEAARRFGEAAETLCARLGDRRAQYRGHYILYTNTYPWTRPHRDSFAPLEEAAERLAELGDFEYAAYCVTNRWSLALMAGEPLAQVVEGCRRGEQEIRSWGFPVIAEQTAGMGRAAALLAGTLPAAPDEPDPLGLRRLQGIAIRTVYPFALSHGLGALYLLGMPESAVRESRALAGDIEGILFGAPQLPEFALYRGLAAARLYRSARGRQRVELWLASQRELHRLKRWARSGPQSFRHKADLLAAELARASREPARAHELFAAAASGAAAGGYTHLQALAFELRAGLARDLGQPTDARVFLREAKRLYAEWGARAKVAQLDARFPTAAAESARHGDGLPASSSLDIATVLKTAQTVSQEIRLERVVERVMAIAAENAGAQRGVLLLERDGRLMVEAEHVVDGPPRHSAQHVPLERCGERLAVSVVRLAARTATPVVLADASRDERFAEDAYIVGHRPRSVICVPILKQAQRVGVLYLENNLAAGAFTADRIEVLRVLASQTAIALENARLYEELRASESRLKDVFDHSAAVMSIKDTAGRYVLVNRRFEELHGVTQQASLGKTDFDLFPARVAEALRENDRRVMQEGRPLEFDESVPGAQGTRDYISVKFPVLDAAGDVYALCGISTDITERKAAEEELEKYRNRLEELVAERTYALEKAQDELVRKEKLAALGQLTATVSHELRNPLSTVSASIFSIGDALARGQTARLDRAVRLAERNIQRCDRIIDELLQFTRRQPLCVAVEPLDPWVRRTLAELGSSPEVTVELELRSDARVSFDPELLRRALVNVWENALQAVGEEGVSTQRLRVETAVRRGRAEIRVTDSGPGIPDDLRDKVFEPLWSTKSFGVGLGVPIVKDIMERHGGGVRFEPAEGQGTTVTLWLPALEEPADDGAEGPAPGDGATPA